MLPCHTPLANGIVLGLFWNCSILCTPAVPVCMVVAQLYSVCISGHVYSSDNHSRNYKDYVTDIMVSVSSDRKYTEDILECLEVFSVEFEVSL